MTIFRIASEAAAFRSFSLEISVTQYFQVVRSQLVSLCFHVQTFPLLSCRQGQKSIVQVIADIQKP